jgi:hypothetical protein
MSDNVFEVPQRRSSAWYLRPSTDWCVTFWRYNAADLNHLRNLRGPTIAYLGFQQEICPDTGRPHLQLFVQFRLQQRPDAVRKFLTVPPHDRERLNRIFLQPRSNYSTPQDAADYCRKVDTRAPDCEPYCYGVLREESRQRSGPPETEPDTSNGQTDPRGESIGGQGSRSDIDNLKRAISTGCDLQYLDDHFPSLMLRYGQAVINMYVRGLPTTRSLPLCFVLWGDSGAGKSSSILNQFDPQKTLWVSPARTSNTNPWWGRYDPRIHSIVIFDEFNPHPIDGNMYISASDINRLCDKTPYDCERKGLQVPVLADTFVFISNHDPRTWWRGQRDVLARFFRRVSLCVKFSKVNGACGWKSFAVSDPLPVYADPVPNNITEVHKEVKSMFDEVFHNLNGKARQEEGILHLGGSSASQASGWQDQTPPAQDSSTSDDDQAFGDRYQVSSSSSAPQEALVSPFEEDPWFRAFYLQHDFNLPRHPGGGFCLRCSGVSHDADNCPLYPQ